MLLQNSWSGVLDSVTEPTAFGLYFHWPFCLSKCPYCDFNSHVSSQIDEAEWLRAFLSEIDRVKTDVGDRILSSIYFGGGTPSLMHPDTVAAILTAVKSNWRLSNDLEITLEANPSSVEAGKFSGYRDAGVNRVSIGVQALNDPDLKTLGRLHSASEARKAVDLATDTFDRVSFDLIYGRQNQSISAWETELTEALSIGTAHLSLYQLTIENGTAFGDRFELGKLRGLPSENTGADMYDLTQEICDAAGLNAYEVSNHAKTGQESRHNLIYWQGQDYAGIGPGAHGRLSIDGKRFATDTPLGPQAWLSQVIETGNGENTRQILSRHDQANEYLMMGLRLRDGISLSRLRNLDRAAANGTVVEHLQQIGMVSVSNDTMSATPEGRKLLNSVIRELLI